MGTPTYTLISETVLGSAQASVTFSSIPGTYKDLVIECVGTYATSGGSNLGMRLNGDTGTNYSYSQIYGFSGGAGSSRGTTQNMMLNIGFSNTEIVSASFQIMSYANANVNKTVIAKGGRSEQIDLFVNLWRNTGAITSVSIFSSASVNLATGFTARLWGVVG